ncbi:Type II secretion system (T2SS), protein N [Tepidimonas thermarum]|uniref:Type II secretion system protein N n=1 Tax=Tepidimonas thermarum TaxID=335431 RepID=A0A554WY51_9BURK|nr:type II secretion system protein N [Tepidimonas thermarum]TSE28497.1 Type II secretion system (T2SS), protein N [Tepidimonas thermarum]
MTPPGRTRWVPAVVGLAVGLLVGSLVFAPARLWALVVPAITGGRIQLLNPHGTVWQGTADVRIHGDGGTLDLPGGMGWRLGASLRPDLGLHLDLMLRCCASTAWRWRWERADGQWRLAADAHRSTWDLAWLAALGSPWNTLGLRGTLRFETSTLQWRLGSSTPSPRASGVWSAQIDDLSAAVSTVRPLGSYRLSSDWQHAGQPGLVLQTLRGDLRLEGQGEWHDGRVRFRGVAEAAPERLDALSNLLNLLGRRDGARAHLRFG